MHLMTNVKLKRCPFCGGIARFGKCDDGYEIDDPNFGAEFVECSNCRTSTKLMFATKEDVTPFLAELWNNRQIESD